MKFQDKVNRIQLITAENEVNIIYGFSKNETFEISSVDKKSEGVISGIPVKIETSEKTNLVSGITDINGRLVLPLPKFNSYEAQKQIVLSMDFHQMKLSPNSYPQTPIRIRINSPLIFSVRIGTNGSF